MIVYKIGDVFSSPDQHIVHGCNAKGVMGSGVAWIIKERYPKAFNDYRSYCDHQFKMNLKPALGYVVPSAQPDGRTIYNMITQENYGLNPDTRYVSYEAIDLGMQNLRNWIEDSVSMPKIGAGLGGGDWKVIEQIIVHRLMGITVNIYSLG